MSIQRWNIRVELCGCTPSALCYEITDDNGRWVKHADHVAEMEKVLEAVRREFNDAIFHQESHTADTFINAVKIRLAARAAEKGA